MSTPTPLIPRARGRRRGPIVAVLAAVALTVGACASTETSDSAAPSDKTGEALKVAYLPCGKINDKSWSQAGYEGVKEAEAKLGLEVSVAESLSPAEVEDAMRDYGRQGYDVVMAHCGSFVDAATKVSAEFPDTWFEAAGVPEAPTANTFAYDPLQEQGSFLAGMLAGFMTGTDTVGSIVAFDFPAFNRQSEAFALGARYANPKVKARTTYIETFEDAAKAKEAAIGQIDQGADVLFVATDQAAVGVFEAAKERGVEVIAQYADQQAIAPDSIITSVLYQQGSTLTEILETIQNGEMKPSSAYTPGLGAGVGDLAPFGTFETKVPDAAKQCLTAAKEAIVSGQLNVPTVADLGAEGSGSSIDPASVGTLDACFAKAS